jgi:hypothetical protein
VRASKNLANYRSYLASAFWFFGLCYAMDWGYKGWNPYVEKHLAIFVNCFLSRANSSIKSLAREGFSQFMPPYRTITGNEEPAFFDHSHLIPQTNVFSTNFLSLPR